MSHFTVLLESVGRGDTRAGEEFLGLVYRELRSIAGARLSGIAGNQTLQPTALVHEAWSRLMGPGRATAGFEGRAHFFAAAAEAMRQILIESARRRAALKRGGGVRPEPIDDLEIPQELPTDEMLAVHEALDELGARDATAAALVKLRYFVGMNMDEAAGALGIPQRSAERIWAYARAWLRSRLASP